MIDKRQQVLDLHNELRLTVAKSRFAHLTSLGELQEFGGKDLYATSVSYIVDSSGPKGIPVTRLRDVLPDSVDLNEAIESLKKAGEIVEVGKGRTISLVSRKNPSGPTEGAPSPSPQGGAAPAPATQAKSDEAVTK